MAQQNVLQLIAKLEADVASFIGPMKQAAASVTGITQAAIQTQQAISKVGKDNGFVEASKKASGFRTEMEQLNDSVSKLSIFQQVRLAAAALQQIGSGLSNIGNRITGFFGAALQETMKVDDAIAQLRVQLGALGNTPVTDKLVKGAEELAKTYGISVTDAIMAVKTSLQDVSTDEALPFMDTVIKAARASSNDLQKTLQLTTDTMDAFGLSTDDASEILGAFIEVQRKDGPRLEEMADMIGKVGPLAKEAGLGFKDLAGMLELVAAKGITGRKAIAAVTEIISTLVHPTEDAKKVLDALGVDFSDNAVKAKGFGVVLAELFSKLEEAKKNGTKLELIDTKAQQAGLREISNLLRQRQEAEDKINLTEADRLKMEDDEIKYHEQIHDLVNQRNLLQSKLNDLSRQSVEDRQAERDYLREIRDIEEERQGVIKDAAKAKELSVSETIHDRDLQKQLNDELQKQKDLKDPSTDTSGSSLTISEKIRIRDLAENINKLLDEQASLEAIINTTSDPKAKQKALKDLARVQDETNKARQRAADENSLLNEKDAAEAKRALDTYLRESKQVSDRIRELRQNQADTEALRAESQKKIDDDAKRRLDEIDKKLRDVKQSRKDALEKLNDETKSKREQYKRDIEEISQKLRDAARERHLALEVMDDNASEKRKEVAKEVERINEKLVEARQKVKDAATEVSAAQAEFMLFGSSVNAGLIVARNGGEDLKDSIDGLKDSTKNLDLAWKNYQTNNPALEMAKLSANIEILMHDIGEKLVPDLEKLVGFLDRVLAWIDNFTQAHPKLSAFMAESGVVLGVLFVVLGGIFTTLASIVVTILGIAAAWPLISAGIAFITGLFPPMSAILAIIWVIVTDLITMVTSFFGWLAAAAGGVVLGLLAVIGVAVAAFFYRMQGHWKIFWLVLGDGWEWLKQSAADVLVWLQNLLGGFLNWVVETIFNPIFGWVEKLWKKITDTTSGLAKMSESTIGGAAFSVYHGITGSFAGGGIANGPDTGHLALLHGREAVIPLAHGSIPVVIHNNRAEENAIRAAQIGSIHIHPSKGQSEREIAQEVFRQVRRRKS